MVSPLVTRPQRAHVSRFMDVEALEIGDLCDPPKKSVSPLSSLYGSAGERQMHYGLENQRTRHERETFHA